MKINKEHIFFGIVVGIFLFFFLLLWIMPEAEAATYLNTASSTTSGTSDTYSLNVGSATDKGVVVSVFVNDGGADTSISVSYGGNALAPMVNTLNTTQEHIKTFFATTSLTGANDISISLGASKTFSSYASVFSGLSGVVNATSTWHYDSTTCTFGAGSNFPVDQSPASAPCQADSSEGTGISTFDMAGSDWVAYSAAFLSNWPNLITPTASTSQTMIGNAPHGGVAYRIGSAPENDIDLSWVNNDTSRRGIWQAVFLEGGTFEGISGSIAFTLPTDSATTTTNFDANGPPANPWTFSYSLNNPNGTGTDRFKVLVRYYNASSTDVVYEDTFYFNLGAADYPISGGTLLIDKNYYLAPGNWHADVYLWNNYPPYLSITLLDSDSIDFVVDNTGVPVFGYPSNYIPFQIYDTATSTATSTPFIEACTDDFWDLRNWKNCIAQGFVEVLRFVFLPHDFSTSVIANAFNNFQSVFPFNIFFQFENVIASQAESVVAANPLIQLPYPIAGEGNFTVMSSSTISDYLGASLYGDLRQAEEYIIWILTGTAIVFMIF